MPRCKIPVFDDSETRGHLCGDFCTPKFNPDDDEMEIYLLDKNDSAKYVEEFNKNEMQRLNEFLMNVQPDENIGKAGFEVANSITVDDCYYFIYSAIKLCIKYPVDEFLMK